MKISTLLVPALARAATQTSSITTSQTTTPAACQSHITATNGAAVLLIEGDIMIAKDRYNLEYETGTGRRRRALRRHYHWDNGLVPYSFLELERNMITHGKNSSEIDEYKSKLVEAMAAFMQDDNGLRFRQAGAGDTHVLEFVSGYADGSPNSFVTPGGSWCWSYVGNVKQNISNDCWDGVTRLNLDPFDVGCSNCTYEGTPTCWKSSTIKHEIGHAIGMHHEQSRPDRDDYITITGCTDNNNEKKSAAKVNSGNITYDYKSIMHYPLGSIPATLNDDQYNRLWSQNVSSTSYIGRYEVLSELDKKGIQFMYNVTDHDPDPETLGCDTPTASISSPPTASTAPSSSADTTLSTTTPSSLPPTASTATSSSADTTLSTTSVATPSSSSTPASSPATPLSTILSTTPSSLPPTASTATSSSADTTLSTTSVATPSSSSTPASSPATPLSTILSTTPSSLPPTASTSSPSTIATSPTIVSTTATLSTATSATTAVSTVVTAPVLQPDSDEPLIIGLSITAGIATVTAVAYAARRARKGRKRVIGRLIL